MVLDCHIQQSHMKVPMHHPCKPKAKPSDFLPIFSLRDHILESHSDNIDSVRFGGVVNTNCKLSKRILVVDDEPFNL